MDVLVAPNAFRGGPDAAWVADALAEGLRESGVVEGIVKVPLADGGDGSLETLRSMVGGTLCQVVVDDPHGEPVKADYLREPDGTVFIESARAIGLHLVADRPKRPLIASSRGAGQLIRTALENGARRVIVSCGGTASVDFGVGALAALGVGFFDAAGREVPLRGHELPRVRRIDATRALDLCRGAEIEVLSDVRTPLIRNVERFGPQKGITAEDARVIGAGLRALARAFGDEDAALLDEPLLGAGGGLSAGLHAVLGAPARGGAEFFAGIAELRARIEAADLVITAEGRFDPSSLEGKLTGLVVSMASASLKPVVVVTGETTVPAVELPAGVRCVELGIPAPSAGRAETPERWRAIADAARNAVYSGVPHAR